MTGTGLTDILQANFILQLCVYSGGQITGWIDGNTAYSGVGSPNTNGDAALVYSSSSGTVKTITFGTTPRTGDVYVRIGLNTSSGITISGISAIADP